MRTVQAAVSATTAVWCLVNHGQGDTDFASVRIFHVPAANAAAIFRGDIIVMAQLERVQLVSQGGGDMPYNVTAPSASVVIGGGGGTGLGNTVDGTKCYAMGAR